MTDADDETLIRQCREGDHRAFETVVERYQGPLFSLALRMVGDYDDARDITQSAFLKAFENLERYDTRSKFYSWIYRITVNEAINHLKRKHRSEPIGQLRALEQNPEEVLGRAELSRNVQESLMRLKPEYRAVIVLRHFMDCSYRDIGGILQLPEKTVKSRLFTARQLLKDALLKRGTPR